MTHLSTSGLELIKTLKESSKFLLQETQNNVIKAHFSLLKATEYLEKLVEENIDYNLNIDLNLV
jgi:hypothetical protein